MKVAVSGRDVHKAFTLIELLVVIAIIAIIAAILFPVFAQAREKARQSACLSNQKQIGLALMQYSQDFDETLPVANYGSNAANLYKWMDMLYPYVKNAQVFSCPTGIVNSLDYVPCTLDPATQTCTNRTGYRLGTYALNGANSRGRSYTGSVPMHNPIGAALTDIKTPANTVFVTEFAYSLGNVFINGYKNATITWDSDIQNPYVVKTTNPWNLTCVISSGVPTPVATLPHANGANVLWCDGHAKWVRGEELAATHTVGGKEVTYLWTIEED